MSTQNQEASVDGDDYLFVHRAVESYSKNNLPSSATELLFPGINKKPVLVVGAGLVGMKVASKLLVNGENVIVANGEKDRPYNRIKLGSVLSGDTKKSEISLRFPKVVSGKSLLLNNVNIENIDTSSNFAYMSNGLKISYANLILATGSRAFVPKISGAELDGVYCFRNLRDIESLSSKVTEYKRVAVIGGGLLGIETSSALSSIGTSNIIIESATHLMAQQLDYEVASRLEKKLLISGIQCITNSRLVHINGKNFVQSISLDDGRTFAVDAVVFCVGVVPNIDLPIKAGIVTNKGIIVDEYMRTSVPNIYAIGECAEFHDKVYGMVSPGYEQADVVASNINNREKRYNGSSPICRLKLAGENVLSVQKHEIDHNVDTVRKYTFKNDISARSLGVVDDEIVSICMVGEWNQKNTMDLIKEEKIKFPKWKQFVFNHTGTFIPGIVGLKRNQNNSPTVCFCVEISHKQIEKAKKSGAQTLEDVRDMTGASTVCGGCSDDIVSLLKDSSSIFDIARNATRLFILSAVALLLGFLILASPEISVEKSFQSKRIFHMFWYEGFWKQTSGYILLSMTALGLLFSLSKRTELSWLKHKKEKLRQIHIGNGIVLCTILIWHTGFRFGENISFLLMSSMVLGIISGSVSEIVNKKKHLIELVSGFQSPVNLGRLLFWVHVLVLWPLPVLIIFHILSVYQY